MSRYNDLLKDPRWQKKRLYILERDGFICQRCGEQSATLNVHHMWYGETPWDVPNYLLITLCEPCHKVEESVDARKAYDIMKVVSGAGVLKSDAVELLACAVGQAGQDDNPRKRFLEVIEHVKHSSK